MRVKGSGSRVWGPCLVEGGNGSLKYVWIFPKDNGGPKKHLSTNYHLRLGQDFLVVFGDSLLGSS